MWENKIDEKVKSWQKNKNGKTPEGKPEGQWFGGREMSCANPVPNACMCSPVGFMIGIGVVFGVVISPIFGASIPVVAKLILRCTAT
jgi:hypothetical protein